MTFAKYGLPKVQDVEDAATLAVSRSRRSEADVTHSVVVSCSEKAPVCQGLWIPKTRILQLQTQGSYRTCECLLATMAMPPLSSPTLRWLLGEAA